MFQGIPKWIRILGGAIFLLFGSVLIVFAIGGVFGILPTDTPGESVPKNTKTATFAAGCFWCTEAAFQEESGVYDVVSGYVGGSQPNPTYEIVSSGTTDYREGVQVTYNPDEISYERLLEIFWKSIDPTDSGGQFVDRGFQYTTAIFRHNQEQKTLAEGSLEYNQENYDDPIATVILPYSTFYEAEAYHQDFYKYSKERYQQYKQGSGRDEYKGESESLRSKSDWLDFTKPGEEELKEQLSFMQYRVTQNDGTEPPFANAYRDNKEEGIYVDIVSGEPLFSSEDKYDSGTGWPSFTQPIGGDVSVVRTKEDTGLFSVRTEVRSTIADSHLGHVFDDGPIEAGGKRYCMNSASMRFVPYDQMDEEGYGEWKQYVKEG